jgi:hypothetical protein
VGATRPAVRSRQWPWDYSGNEDPLPRSGLLEPRDGADALKRAAHTDRWADQGLSVDLRTPGPATRQPSGGQTGQELSR